MCYLLDIWMVEKSRTHFHLKVTLSPSKSSRNIKMCRKGAFKTVFVRNKVNRRGKVRVYFEKKYFCVENDIYYFN